MRDKLRIGRWAVCVFICLWSLFPIYWAVNTSLMTTVGAESVPARFFPSPLDVSNYRHIFGLTSTGPGGDSLSSGFQQTTLNSLIESITSTALTVAVAALAAYAFARMKFRGRTPIFYIVLATMALPAYATLIPLYRIMSNAGLVNTYTGIVLVYVSGFLPLAMWILYNYFLTIPRDLEEAALIDGASEIKALLHIVLPLALPGLTAAAIITFLSAWGQFLFPLVLTTDLSTEPLTVYITSLQGQRIIPYTLLNALGVIAIILPALMVLFLNRYIIRGILAGSMK